MADGFGRWLFERMDCARTRFLLNPFLDGELSDHDRKDVAAHLFRCPRCSSRLESFRRLRTILKESSPRQPAPAELCRRIAERQAPVRGWRRALRPVASAFALSLLVLPVVADSPAHPLSEANLISETPVERTVHGRFFCLQCALRNQLAGTSAAAARTPIPHLAAFRSDEGEVWILLNGDACPDSLPKREVAVAGRFFESSHLLAAESYH